MPGDRTSHFVVPASIVHSDAIRVRGRNKPFTRPSYSAHADFLRERTAALRTFADAAVDAQATDSLFLQVKTPAEFPVEKERQRLSSAGFEIVALSPVDPSTGTARIRKSLLNRFEGKVSAYGESPTNRGKSYLSIIEDIHPIPAAEKLSPDLATTADDPVDCLLIFYSTLTEGEQAGVLLAARSFLARTGGSFGKTRRFANGVFAVEARLRPSQALSAGEAFSTLREVRPDRVYFVPDSWRISAVPQTISIDPPFGRTAVAVVDTGIDPTCRELAGCVQTVLPHLPAGAIGPHPEHGTFVGSRVSYGDRLIECLRQGRLTPMAPLVDIPVFGVDVDGRLIPIHEGHLASSIDLALPALPSNARVVNLSLGTDTAVVDGHVSIVASLLDHHARARDLLVVTSAGNIRDLQMFQEFPNSHLSESARIDSPADSLHALTVGSIAHNTEEHAISRARELSAFSRRGPGPFGGIKPDIVAHGGNCHANGKTSDLVGVHGLLSSTHGWATDYGTSFAAPLVSAMGAALMDHYDRPSANLVKALLLHFTVPVLSPSIALPREHLVGRGEPDLDGAQWANPHAATFLHSGVLAPTRFTYVPFQVPPCLAPGGTTRLRIRATVVINPPVAPDNPLEYCQARLTLGLRKPTEVGHSTVGNVDCGLDPGKWSPVEHLQKRFSRSYGSGMWELVIRLWTRNLPDSYVQPFAAVIQVIDETGTGPVLAEIDSMPQPLFQHAVITAAA